MKKNILFLITVLMTCCVYGQNNYKLKPEQMTGWKTQSIQGKVNKVTYSDGHFVEFNKDGNIIKENPDLSTVYEYNYVSANRYTFYNEAYNVIYNDSMRIEKWDNQHEDLTTDFVFDALGRIKKKNKVGYGEWINIEYFYKNKDVLPHKVVETLGWEDGYTVETSLCTYTQKDKEGNWLACSIERKTEEFEGESPAKVSNKKLTSKRTITYFSDSDIAATQTYDAKDTTAASGKTNWGGIVELILGIALFGWVIGHMVYVNFIAGKRYKEVFTPEYFRQNRMDRGLNEYASREEDLEVRTLLERAFEEWPVVDTSGEQVYRKPKKMKQIKSAAALIDQAIALAPTDSETIDRLNELTDVVNSNEERSFFGSKTLIVIAIVVCAVFSYFMFTPIAIVSTVLGVIMYILASRTPAFLIDKRVEKGRGSLSKGVLGGVLAMIAGAQTVRTVTTWSDGSKTKEDDYSQHWIAIFIGIIVIVLLGIYIALWALVNYLRNYVLYV